MSDPVKHRLFPGFAGVALADILANGVAIIILMIVITMMIKHQQEEKRLEQVEDVTVLLSRDLATSAVMNALPTSPPARLHDYETSPLDRNPTHALMPIMELHTNYVRNYYTGERFTRDELLLQNNAFDRYVKSLTPLQLVYMRVDIYSIRLFYIFMSILKDHNTRPGHWHFIGYPEGGGPGEGGGSGESIIAGKGEDDGEEETEPERGPGEGADVGENLDGKLGGAETRGGVPQETSFDANPGGVENYPYDDLAFRNDGATGGQQAPEDLPGEVNEPRNERERTSNEFFNTLAEMMMQGLSGESQGPQTRLSRFRSARAGDGTSDEDEEGMPGEGEPFSGQAADLRELLPALFEFMRQIQAEADAGGATRLAEYNFRRDVLPLMGKPSALGAKHGPLFERLSQAISDVPQDTEGLLKVSQKTDARLRSNALEIETNRRLHEAALAGNAMQERRDDLPGELRPTLHFGLYPAIYQGLRAPLKKDALVLMPPEQTAPSEFRWRVVTMVNPAADDFMTAFVYAALDDRGRLLLASEENALNLADFRVETNYPTLPFRNEQWLLLIYGIPALLLALGALRRAKKTA